MFRVLSPVVTACVAESNHDNNSTNTGLGSLVPRMLLKVFHEGRVNNLNPDSETGFSAEAQEGKTPSLLSGNQPQNVKKFQSFTP